MDWTAALRYTHDLTTQEPHPMYCDLETQSVGYLNIPPHPCVPSHHTQHQTRWRPATFSIPSGQPSVRCPCDVVSTALSCFLEMLCKVVTTCNVI